MKAMLEVCKSRFRKRFESCHPGGGLRSRPTALVMKSSRAIPRHGLLGERRQRALGRGTGARRELRSVDRRHDV